VIVPSAVFAELQHRKTPAKVKPWISNSPSWVEVRQANLAAFTSRKKIGPGEQEAFAIALELQATAVSLDDWAAMIEA
jgi:predicted nucleic acid-binding protein